MIQSAECNMSRNSVASTEPNTSLAFPSSLQLYTDDPTQTLVCKENIQKTQHRVCKEFCRGAAEGGVNMGRKSSATDIGSIEKEQALSKVIYHWHVMLSGLQV